MSLLAGEEVAKATRASREREIDKGAVCQEQARDCAVKSRGAAAEVP